MNKGFTVTYLKYSCNKFCRPNSFLGWKAEIKCLSIYKHILKEFLKFLQFDQDLRSVSWNLTTSQIYLWNFIFQSQTTTKCTIQTLTPLVVIKCLQ